MDKIDTLCLSGGALKGIAYTGLLKYLTEKDIIKNIKSFYGVSVGSFAALLFALGYTYKEIKTIIFQINFTTLLDSSFENFIENYGINKGDKLNNFIKIFITNKKYDKDISLLEFYNKTGKYLCFVSTNVSKKKEEYIDYISFPEIPIWKAVRMSCNIPFVFEPVKYNGDIYVDGFLTENIPLPKKSGENVLCVFLSNPIIDYSTDTLTNYMYSLFKTSIFKLYSHSIENIKREGNLFIEIHLFKTDSVNFKISNEERNKLIIEGYKQTKAFFEKDFS